jgi:Na+-transporting methylmalonyl-CoA/oxaloacetate decarboxylase gamma subunit
MRGISLLVLVLGVVFVGYLNVRSVEEHVPADPQRKGTAEQVEQQVQDTLQQYQEKLDKQAESQ